MNPTTPSRESAAQAQRHGQMMMRVAPEQFEELIISHISRRLELNDGKLDELMNGVSKGKSSIATLTKASLKRIASPFQATKSRTGSDKEGWCGSGGTEVSWQWVGAISKLITSLSSSSELKMEGLFRKSGNCARVKELNQRMVEDGSMDLGPPYTTHDRATVLKHLLRDIAEPLLLSRHLEAFRQAIALGSNGVESGRVRCLRVVQLLMLHLPRNNAVVARRLLTLLGRVAKEAANKMDAAALATVFSPHLLCSSQLQVDPILFNTALTPATAVVKFLIENCGAVFHSPVEFSRDVAHFVQSECAGRLPPEDGTPGRWSCTTPVGWEGVLSPVSLSSTGSTEEDVSTTQMELAKLQAHIQAMPAEAKRKLSKQLNNMKVLSALHATPSRDNTPTPSKETPRKRFRSKSLGSSIKKRLPMFKNKDRHPGGGSDLSGSLTAVNIDFEETSSKSVAVDSKRGGRLSVKRTADWPLPSSPLPSSSNHPHLMGQEDVTPPKVAHTDTPDRGTPRVATAPQARAENLDTPAAAVKVKGYTPAAAVKVKGYTPVAAVKVKGYTPVAAVKVKGYTPVAAVKVKGYTPVAAVKVKGYTPVAAVTVKGDTPVAAVKVKGDTPVAAVKVNGDTPVAAVKVNGDTPVAAVEDKTLEGGTPLPSTENGREYLAAPDPKERVVQQVRSPVRRSSDGEPFTHGAQQSRGRSRDPRRVQSVVRSVETSL